jgi:hypothetical protein
VEKPELGKPMLLREDNIKIGLKTIGWEIVDFIYLAEDRENWKAVVNVVMNTFVNMVMNIRFA